MARRRDATGLSLVIGGARTDLTDQAQPMGRGRHCVPHVQRLHLQLLRTQGRTERARLRFQRTDIEVAHATVSGVRLCRAFDGMFAFGLFDTIHRSLLSSRPAGDKPRPTRVDDQLVFCSELKGILGFPGFRRRLNLRAVSAFLSYRHPVEAETYFAGVHSLPPGCQLVVRDGHSSVSRYWELGPLRSANFPKVSSERVAELIALAVKAQVTSDVPVVTFLSGGLDSSILLSEATRATGRPVPAITARFDECGLDESPHARDVARHLGSPLQVIDIESAGYLGHAPHLMAVKDQPLGMHNEVAVMLLAQPPKKLPLCSARRGRRTVERVRATVRSHFTIHASGSVGILGRSGGRCWRIGPGPNRPTDPGSRILPFAIHLFL